MITTIDHQGRIELPRDLQLQLGVRPGDEVSMEGRGTECIISSSRTASGLCLEGNVLVHRAGCHWRSLWTARVFERDATINRCIQWSGV